ncbi:HAD-IB family hydrolase [Nocardioides sp.]|uniref:HAD family hydrolase n=1 Tax=Nocardioides sp. TaxID=35761 RepID=UPI002C4F2DB1|nr:HAD-IB family hydrolase [Nocardioides sp.]HXH79408.1 HAD-IB family hydrolase [Nocardioides sp.]
MDLDGITALIADVDETIIHDKSMFSFLDFLAAQVADFDAAAVRRQLFDLAAGGGSREDANHAYYAALEGQRDLDLALAGRMWFAHREQDLEFWIPFTVDLVTRAVDAGIPVVFVSGSHRACVDAIARHLGVEHVLCTEVELRDDGTLTGHRVASAIGAAKRARVLEWAAAHRVDLAGALALGDHDSDIAFMELAGAAIAINPSAGLAREVARRGWRSVESTGGAAA